MAGPEPPANADRPADLQPTYQQAAVHDRWESVYRGNPRQDRFNVAILHRLLRVAKLPADALVLDAGCGVGYHTLALARQGFQVVGVDVSETILQTARENARRLGLEQRVNFFAQALEKLDLASATFDAVHCRGVLMHVPAWEQALAQLCRVLKPGGKMLILESNTQAVETGTVRLVRRLRASQSRRVDTAGGLEFWSNVDGQPFLVRITRIAELVRQMEKNGVHLQRRLATEFWDIYRFQTPWLRNLAIHFNRLWFALRLPAWPSMGNALVGKKK